MKVKIKMPDVGNSEAEIEVKRWLVMPGERVKRGQVLLEVEADKGVIEVESFVSGTLREQCVDVGGVAEEGDIIAVMAAE